MKKWEELPQQIRQRMLECQVEQGNKRDEEVFKSDIVSCKEEGGFSWGRTKEGEYTWEQVIGHDNYQPFYNLHNKQKETTFEDLGLEIWEKPKLMKVRDNDDNSYNRFAWVIGKSENYVMSKGFGDTIGKPFGLDRVSIYYWDFAEEIKEETLEEKVDRLEQEIEKLKKK
jgi:hypothetical protein